MNGPYFGPCTTIRQYRDSDQSIQDEHDAELEAAREADSFSFGLKRKLFNPRGGVMETQDQRDQADCTIVRSRCCGCVRMAVVTTRIDEEIMLEIGEAIAEGCSVEHMPAVDARKQNFLCSCAALPQNDLLELAPQP